MRVSLAVGFCLYLSAVLTSAKLYGKDPKYSNVWVAKIEGGEETAQRVAKDLGFAYMGKCGQFEDYYEMTREDHPHVSTRGSDHLTSSLLDIDEVKWAKQQKLVKPVIDMIKPSKGIDGNFINTQSRELSTKDLSGDSIMDQIRFSFYTKEKLPVLTQGDLSKLGSFPTMPGPGLQVPEYRGATKNSGQYTGKTSAYAKLYNDPNWKDQWDVQDYRTTDMPVMDLNVVPVHKMGLTGKGVTVAVVDTGVFDNPDITPNIDHALDYDFCEDFKKETDEDKTKNTNKRVFHGTHCAAVIAMVPNNGICGVGIAYNVRIAGIRAVCPHETTESVTGKALIHKLDEIDIYSNSWGFDTYGKYVSQLDELTALAYQEGTTKGRNKKGAIYLHSAGNDKAFGDNCGHDGTINTPYVITITGANQWGNPTAFSERCTAILASTYTKDYEHEGIVAATGDDGCRTDFGGTSAACPQASAIVALTLEANPELTYRDVMHLITMSAEVAPLADNKKTWYKNGRGFWVSNDFGFGLMNAQNMVTLAKGWQNVPKKHTCIVTVKLDVPKLISVEDKVKVPFYTTGCEGSETDEVNYLEHVELASIVTFPYRGYISVFLTSPSGTRSKIFECRLRDDDIDGLEGWPIMSTHNWGEFTKGTWIVEYKICNRISLRVAGLVYEFTVKFHGTKEMPEHYKKTRQYAAFRTPEGNTNLSP